MKKVVLLLITSFGIGVSTFAQDINKAKTYFMLKQYESAKTEIDQCTINPKANAEAWYTKAQVYIMLAADSALKIKYPNVIFEYRYYNDLDIHGINYNCLFLRYEDKFKELSCNFLMKYFKKYKSLNIYIDYDLKMDLNNIKEVYK